MNKLKVSFEVEDIYNQGDFRAFIKFLLTEADKYELFIISNDDSSEYIRSIGTQLGLDEENVIVCNFTDDKTQAIIDNKIDIHLDNLQSFIILVDSETDAYGVLVSSMVNKYYVEPDYMVVFRNTIEQIKRDSEES